ncbi:MAG: hypothetical protein IH851_07730 [Armatimonadetes bacterium]|nr:hypothetical protein [Armatimonadota bacterium]
MKKGSNTGRIIGFGVFAIFFTWCWVYGPISRLFRILELREDLQRFEDARSGGNSGTEEAVPVEAPDAAYLDSARLISERMTESMDRLDQLRAAAVDNPILRTDEAWRSQVASEMMLWQVQPGIARGIDPPAAFAEAHKKFVAALDIYSIEGDKFMRWLDTGEPAVLRESRSRFHEARTLLRSWPGEFTESR